MNARRRTRPDGLPGRVYEKGASYYWVRPDNKWIRLSKVLEGDLKMLERLTEEKRRFQPVFEGHGNLPAIISTYMDQKASTYAASYRDEWKRRGEGVRSYFRDWNIERIDAAAVEDFLLNNWPEKLPTQRAMKARLSTFFSWAVRKKFATINPTREVKVKKPKKRNVYIRDDDFMAIREWLLKYSFTLHEGTPQAREVTGTVPIRPS